MRYLFNNWKKIERLLRRSPHILLLTDYDGTLTPIKSRPENALLDNSIRKILRRLFNKREKFHIGVISGRKLEGVEKLVRLPGIYYAGNHGLEIRGPKIKFLHPAIKKIKPYMTAIRRRLASKTRSIKGAIVEDKGGSLSLHYRLVQDKEIKRLKAVFNEVCAPYLKKGKIKLSSGKKVWEVRPPLGWDKASAIGRILKVLKNKKVLPIYLGDDVTDEDVFGFLKKREAVTVFVGRPKKSKAGYYLKSPGDVKRFLIRLCQL